MFSYFDKNPEISKLAEILLPLFGRPHRLDKPREAFEDGSKYYWIDPIYLPPILWDLKWHETEKSDI